MSWIKIDEDFPDHPKVLKLAERMGISQTEAVGLLAAWFCWCRRYCQTGFVKGEMPVPEKYGDFPVALREAGFILPEGWISSWEEYGGAEIVEYAKREGCKGSGGKYREMIDFYGIIPYGEKTGKKRGKHRLEEKRIEEKRREEKKPKTLPPKEAADGVLEALVEKCYQAYPTKRDNGSSTGKSTADKKAIRRILEDGKYDLLTGIEFHKNTSRGFPKNLKTFLNNLPDLSAVEVQHYTKPKSAPACQKCQHEISSFNEPMKCGTCDYDGCRTCVVEHELKKHPEQLPDGHPLRKVYEDDQKKMRANQ